MGIKIFLRKTSSQNCFRKLVTELPNIVDLNKLILCSGFFQEDIGGYLASTENNFCNMLNNNNVEVTTYGVYNNTWLNRYKNFITGLVSAGVKVKAMYKSGTKWHAKILIYKYDDLPVIGIIGSSNITRPAFSITPPFNYESDVLLYIPSVEQKIEKFVKEMNSEYVIDAQYDPKRNNGVTVEDRLRGLEKDILEGEWKELEL